LAREYWARRLIKDGPPPWMPTDKTPRVFINVTSLEQRVEALEALDLGGRIEAMASVVLSMQARIAAHEYDKRGARKGGKAR
jgi:hypothetical protein